MIEDDIVFVDVPPWQILVADDSSLWRRVATQAIQASGNPVIVHEAADGGEALEILSNRAIDLAFIDLSMPELTGDEVVDRIGKEGRMPFFVVISADDDVAQIARMRQLSAYDYLVKPFGGDAITRILKTYERVKARTSVLIIDDSETNRSIIRRLLERTVFQLDIAGAPDGVSAFELYVKNPADIVFLDVNMPGLDGEQTLRILRAHSPNVRVILMSGDQKSLDSLARYRATDYLRKPFRPADLDLVIHKIFGLDPPFAA